MTVVTTRPDATLSSSGFPNTGGGSRHGATSDSSDSTYVIGSPGDGMTLGFAEPTIPAGGLVKSLAVRMRSAQSSWPDTPQLKFHLFTQVSWPIVTVNVTWGGATTTTVVGPLASNVTPTDVVVDLEAPAGEAILHELYFDTTYVAKPVTAPSAPSGTVTTTNTPTATWANTLDADGGPQTRYQVRVFTAAQYGAGGFNAASSTATWDSGDTLSGSLSAQIAAVLADATYRAYVRTGQTVGGVTHWSDYAYTAFTIDTDNPATPDTPTLTVHAGRIEIYVEGNAGAATTTHLEVQRSIDGADWTAVRALRTDGLVDGSSGTVYDYEAPNGVQVSYRVRALHDYTGSYTYSDWSATATATWSSSDWWLKCPEHPALNMPVNLASLPGHQRAARHGVFQPLGATSQVVVADTRGGATGTIGIRLDTPAERAALDALIEANATLLLQGPAVHDEPDHYLRLGDQDRKRWIDLGFITERIDTLTWLEVARPTGVVVAWPT